MIRPFRWDSGNRVLHLLDQRRLPREEVWITCREAAEVARAIRELVVRGAPAIGIAAAYAVVLGFARSSRSSPSDPGHPVGKELPAGEPASSARFDRFLPFERFENLAAALEKTRPTAVNLAFALGRMRVRLGSLRKAPPEAASPEGVLPEIVAELEAEADRIAAEDLAANRRLGALGAGLLPGGPGPARILTHCNAGALATSGYGTALGIVRAAAAFGRQVEVFAPETRPFLQGARLTAWELLADRIPVTLMADGAVGSLFASRRLDAVIVGADRIARNGDTANKIGTYPAAVLAQEHGVPFLVAAPFSSVDLETPTGAEIPIEERPAEEVTEISGKPIAPAGVPVWNPVFDITPARFLTAIVTERGIARPPFSVSLASLARLASRDR